tara:strand:+ start:3459 stop:4340 length:882 start_codon:yes stop_codon:yes gene_type:complete
MKVNEIYILEDRGILYIQGPDSEEFLQNIITNDVKKITDKKSCFASILTPQGKYLYDFIISKHKKGFFIDCEKNQIESLFKQLKLYKLRSKVEILNLSNEFVIAALTLEKFKSIENISDSPGFTIKFREDPIVLDPRNIKLGARLIINLEKLYLSIKKLNLNTGNINEYYKLSHKLGIPQTNTIKLQNKIFGIECNLEELNGIDFKKGCYVGQENTARIKLKNKLSKKLFPIKFEGIKINSDDIITKNNKEIGKVLIDGEYPFAVFKINDINFSLDQIYECSTSKVKIIKTEI